jgi:hypothetical protein
MARCRECNSKVSKSMEYCPQCGVHNPADYNVQAFAIDQVRRKRSNFVVPFLGVGAILVMIAIYVGGPARNKPSDAEATIHTGSVSNLNILENKEFLAKSPKYPEAIRALITSSGYECPRLSSLFLSPEITPMGNKLEALCGPRGGGAYRNLHYSVYPDRLKVVVCKPFGVFGGGCD